MHKIALYLYNTEKRHFVTVTEFKYFFDIHFFPYAFKFLSYVKMYSVYITFMYLILFSVKISSNNLMQLNL